ncbi:hypothetical protein ACWGLC_10700 [Dietzia sp. NPDC055877]
MWFALFVRNPSMSSFKRILVGTSVLALASGAILAGAGSSAAQGSSEVAAGLELEAAALKGPVKVTQNSDGGPTVAYSNATGAGEKCVGAAMPYRSVLQVGLDLTGDEPPADLIPKVREIQEMGGVSGLSAGLGGGPVAYEVNEYDGIPEAISMLVSGRGGLGVDGGATATWTAPSPETPAIAAVFCIPDSVTDTEERSASIVLRIGVDPQGVVDQVNGILPGGSVTAGSVSDGSLEMGTNLLGSLGS